MTDVPHIPNVVDLKPLLSASTAPSYGVKEKNRPSKRYRGRWTLDGKGDSSGTIDVIVETIPLADVPDEKRTEALRKLSERVRLLASQPKPHVLPILAAGELPDDDYYVVRPYVEGISLADDRGLSAAENGKVDDLAEQLLTGLAALHCAGVAFGDLQLEDVRFKDSGNEDSKPTLWLSGAEFGELDSITGGYLVRSGNDDGDSRHSGERFSGDLQRLGHIICQVAGGNSSNSRANKIRDASLRKFVEKHLLGNLADRPPSASAALQKLAEIRKSRSRNCNRIALATALTALIFGAILFSLWASSKIEGAKLMSERTAAQQNVATLQQEKQQLAADLQQRRGGSPPIDVRKEASQLFNKYYGRDKPILMTISDWLDAELKGRRSEEISEIKQQFNIFEKDLQGENKYALKLNWAATNNSKHQGKDDIWLLTVYVDGDKRVSKTFQPGKNISQLWEFDWQPEQSIQVLVRDFPFGLSQEPI
jgi:hypothetical protein